MSNEIALRTEIDELKKSVAALQKQQPKDKVSMLILSGDMDRMLASFVIASGAIAMGSEVTMFFTFWGITAIRDPQKSGSGKNIIEKMFGFMLPSGAAKLPLSQMNFMGMGPLMIGGIMKKKKVPSVTEFLALAAELGVKIRVCEMSMDLMGFKREEFIQYPGIEFCGAAKFLEDANESRVTLFI